LTSTLVALVAATSFACNSDDEADPSESPTASIDGNWITEGYGLALSAHEGTVDAYEITAKSCIHLVTATAASGAIAKLGMNYEVLDGKLHLRDAMTGHMTAARVKSLPPTCANGGTKSSDDPVENFEIYWRTFDEQYAFFELYGVDWQARYDEFRPRVTDTTSKAELFEILSEMTAPLKDGHVSLETEEDYYCPQQPPEWLIQHEEELVTRLTEQYLKGKDVTLTGNGRIGYRRLSGGVGYALIVGMEGFGKSPDTELEVAGKSADELVAAFADAPAVILDVRFNGGGFDATALTLASRFADEKHLAFTKKTRNGDQFAPLDEYHVTPAGPKQYEGQVIVLTSVLTASAAEIFVMAMRELPNVVVIGEPTSGGHSDILGRTLPNGWQFGLSNQVYYTADGKQYESIGIPPDVSSPFDAAAFLDGKDSGIEAALEKLGTH
jgi:hypothetical protein